MPFLPVDCRLRHFGIVASRAIGRLHK